MIKGCRKQGQRTTPFCLRLTDKERSELEKRAGQLALGTYIKSCLFNKTPPRVRSSTKNSKALAQLLAWLGKSNIASNLQTLADAAKSGSLPLSPETTVTLQQACKDIADIKSMLMKALVFRSISYDHTSFRTWRSQTARLAYHPYRRQ